MSYQGKNFIIPCDKGGLTHNPNVDTTPAVQMINPTRNLNLQEMGRTPRGGTSILKTLSVASLEIKGVYDYTLKDTTQYIVTAASSGALYKDDANTIKTGMSTSNFYSFATFANTMFVADGYSVPQTWDGEAAATSDITSPADDWTANTQPIQFVVHGRKTSERLWAIMGGTSDYNSSVYGSADGDGNDFSAANVKKFDIQTGDGHGIVGGVEFGDRLVCMGKNKAYIIDDTDTDSDKWGYEASQWEGGVAHWRLMTKTVNDIVCMMENGEIYSVAAAENYGDYKAASLTRPANIHKWIKENIDLAQIDKFHSVYDPKLRAIKFFMVRKGFLEVDMALCFFIDVDPREAWMRHDNDAYDSGYKASCAALVRKSVGNHKVYTGDYASHVWELESTNKNDNSNGYYAGFRTPAIDCENPRATKNFKRLWLSVRPYGEWDLTVKWWVDGMPQAATSLELSGGPVLGTFILGTDALGGIGILDGEIDLGENGRRIQFECYNETANQSFFLNQMMIDYRELGNEPR